MNFSVGQRVRVVARDLNDPTLYGQIGTIRAIGKIVPTLVDVKFEGRAIPVLFAFDDVEAVPE